MYHVYLHPLAPCGYAKHFMLPWWSYYITVSTERKYTFAAKPSTQNRAGLEEK